VNARHLRDYLERGWARAEELEREHWARVRQEQGALATVRAAGALFEQMRRLRPDWPDENGRRDDLEHHVAQQRLLQKAGRALRAR
jgi:hypothetical protein